MLYLLAGAARLGFIAAFLSQPILTGYINGIALIILIGQLPKLLGYPSADNEFVLQLRKLVIAHPVDRDQIDSIHPTQIEGAIVVWCAPCIGTAPSVTRFLVVRASARARPWHPARLRLPDLGRVLGDRCRTCRSWRQSIYIRSLNHSLRECESGQPKGHVHDSGPALRTKAQPTFLERLQHCSVVWQNLCDEFLKARTTGNRS
jgi:Sulfate permease family